MYQAVQQTQLPPKGEGAFQSLGESILQGLIEHQEDENHMDFRGKSPSRGEALCQKMHTFWVPQDDFVYLMGHGASHWIGKNWQAVPLIARPHVKIWSTYALRYVLAAPKFCNK